MSNNIHDNVQQLFNSYLETGGKPAVTHFRQWLNSHIDQVVKPQCKSSSRSGGGLAEWKTEILQRFGGRGAKWSKISLTDIAPTLERLENDEGIDVSHYRALINQAGFAWIRFDNARVHNGKNCVSFKVLTEGSTFMQPGRLHYIDVSRIDEVITPLGGTPKSLDLETLKTQSQSIDDDSQEEVIEEEVTQEEEVIEEVSHHEEIPTDEDYNDDDF